MCELCKRRKPAADRKLCTVCHESILRLANAVRAMKEEQRLTLTALAASLRR
jgi:hypothetical protein